MVRRHLLLAAVCMLAGALPAAGQARDIRDSQLKLDSIRQEQRRLQQELGSLQSRVRDASRELANIARQREASASALLELDFQAAILAEDTERLNQELATTQSQLQRRTVLLRQRLRSIYKRGPLHSVQVLLSAESFSNLLNRYKYLHLLALNDRAMVNEVASLERTLRDRDRELGQTLQRMEALRLEKETEVAALERLETRREGALRQYRQAQTRTEGRLDQLAREQARLSDLVARLERERLEEERRRASAGAASTAATLSTRDLGSLNWPVDGRLLYRFGPQRQPNGVVLRNQGIGIAAMAGSAVQSVEAGTVVLARPFEGYGPTVMLSHGGGYYTLYLYLRSIGVREGQTLPAGATVGTVGGEQTPEGAHIEFQVRAPVRGGVPEAVDPLSWLRTRAGGSR